MEFNLADVFETVASEVGDRECIVWGDTTWTYSEVDARVNRLANRLVAGGLGASRERADLEGWESGQDHVALYMYNSNAYLEGMLGAFKARCAPFNVNYRYVEEELLYLLADSKARAIIYHAEFAPRVAAIRDDLPDLELFLQVEDDSGNALLPGAVAYEDALAGSSPDRPPVERSPDDLYILYTGGTTGMPKGVLWRQHDILLAAMLPATLRGQPVDSVEAFTAAAQAGGMRVLPVPPFMHGAAHWLAFGTLLGGGTTVIQRQVRALDADDIWSTVEAQAVQVLLLVGDAFARPLLDQLRVKEYDTSALMVVASGGAILNKTSKQEFMDRLGVLVLDALGSSEAGMQGTNTSGGGNVTGGTFLRDANSVILNEDLTAPLEPGSEEAGWLAQRGHVPLGYLGDPTKSAATYPVVDGVRYSVPGDRARLVDAMTYELLGRESVTINSGGEKIFAEEVESALKHHPAVFDAVVAGRPSERWGSEVVAVVQLRDGVDVSDDELSDEAARHIARYKLPKDYVYVDEVVRGPNGKADYRWAKDRVSD
ncbi:MAG: acyl-CoA synthetase [Acidimicrobiia bacterium]|nr:acyl-CoA synthetase [Acidimicrobiia bacterium]